MLSYGIVSNAVIRPHTHLLPACRSFPARKSFRPQILLSFIPFRGPHGGWRHGGVPCTGTKSPGCWWPCPRRMLRMALCSLFLIAGLKQLINCSARCPIPAAATQWGPPRLGHAQAQPLCSDFGLTQKTQAQSKLGVKLPVLLVSLHSLGRVVRGVLRKGSCAWPEQLSISRYPQPPLQTRSQFSQLKNAQLTERSLLGFLGSQGQYQPHHPRALTLGSTGGHAVCSEPKALCPKEGSGLGSFPWHPSSPGAVLTDLGAQSAFWEVLY